MRIVDFSIQNFRSIRQLSCNIGKMTVFLGPNNHGKSNVIAALEFLLTPGMKITPDDFFSGRTEDENRLEVKADFADLTEQEKTTFKKYVRADKTIRIQRWAMIGEAEKIDTEYRGYLQQPTLWWLQEAAFDRLRNRQTVEEAAREVPELTTLLEGGGRITKERVEEFQTEYVIAHREELQFVEVLEESPLLGVKNIAGGTLPDFYLIPAVRDLGDETKTTGTATFGRLLQRAVSEMTARDPRFIELQEGLSVLVDELNQRSVDPDVEPASALVRLERRIKAELESWGVDVNIRVTPPEVRKVLELGTELWIDDGHSTVAERKGHGLQRAVIFSLIKAWSSVLRSSHAEDAPRARAASESLVFAYEEPELFLHPHAQRDLADALKTIAETPEHQVLVCTHSTHFVDLENYRAIVIVHRPSPQTGTKIRQCSTDLFAGEENRERKHRFQMASWINPDRGELFFARKVVLVEGETEKIVLPFLAKRLDCYDRTMSVIDCGSKHNLPLYIDILNAFSIGYVVVHDEDPVPDPIPPEWTPEKTHEKQRTFALNKELRNRVPVELGQIEVVTPDFERFSGIPKSQGEKKGKPLAALDHFNGLDTADIPPAVVDLVTRVFTGPTGSQEQNR